MSWFKKNIGNILGGLGLLSSFYGTMRQDSAASKSAALVREQMQMQRADAANRTAIAKNEKSALQEETNRRLKARQRGNIFQQFRINPNQVEFGSGDTIG